MGRSRGEGGGKDRAGRGRAGSSSSSIPGAAAVTAQGEWAKNSVGWP
jgi:hypothetical protein